jgi:ABC-type multidrug transport system fused ATPase/permease subunit
MSSDDGGLTKSQVIVDASVAFISMAIIAYFFIVYMTDYYYAVSSPSGLLAGHARSKSKTSSPAIIWQKYPYESYVEYFNRVILARFSEPTLQDLHNYIIANFVFVLLARFVSALSFLDDRLSWNTLATLTSLETAFYAACKFCQTGFFIVRYQLTARELRSPNRGILILLWLVNALSFFFMFASLFSNPPYFSWISEDAGLSLTILFIIGDIIANVVVLYLLIAPISQHVRELKKKYANEPKNVDPNARTLTSQGIAVKNEKERIKKFKKVVKTAIMACGLCLTVTVLVNAFWLIAYYFETNVYSGQGFNVWLSVYNTFTALDYSVCSLSPVFNYPRFAQMWKFEVCTSTPEEEDLITGDNSTGTSGGQTVEKTKPIPVEKAALPKPPETELQTVDQKTSETPAAENNAVV